MNDYVFAENDDYFFKRDRGEQIEKGKQNEGERQSSFGSGVVPNKNLAM